MPTVRGRKASTAGRASRSSSPKPEGAVAGADRATLVSRSAPKAPRRRGRQRPMSRPIFVGADRGPDREACGPSEGPHRIRARPEVDQMAPVVKDLAASAGAPTVVMLTGQPSRHAGGIILDVSGGRDHRSGDLQPEAGPRLCNPAGARRQYQRVIAAERRTGPGARATHHPGGGGVAAFYAGCRIGMSRPGCGPRSAGGLAPEEDEPQRDHRLAIACCSERERPRQHARETWRLPKIVVTANTVVDALFAVVRSGGKRGAPAIGRLGLVSSDPAKKNWGLVTGHRREKLWPWLRKRSCAGNAPHRRSALMCQMSEPVHAQTPRSRRRCLGASRRVADMCSTRTAVCPVRSIDDAQPQSSTDSGWLQGGSALAGKPPYWLMREGEPNGPRRSPTDTVALVGAAASFTIGRRELSISGA